MKKILTIAAVLVVTVVGVCFAEEYVNDGHCGGPYTQSYRRNGSYGCGGGWNRQCYPYDGERGYSRN